MKKLGFTLIELLLVLVLIGILSFISYPSYNRHLIRVRRIHMENMLLDIAGRMERHYIINNTYDGIGEQDSKLYSDYYLVDIVPSGDRYFLKATPVGKQTKDRSCGVLMLDQDGKRSSTGSADSKSCWLS